MNFAHKESFSARFSLKKLFVNGKFMITLSWYTSAPNLLHFESFTACNYGSPLICFSTSFPMFSVPLIHLSEKHFISLILGSHFLQSEHPVLISKSSFSWNSFSHFLSNFIVVAFFIWTYCVIHTSSKSRFKKVKVGSSKNIPCEWKTRKWKKEKKLLLKKLSYKETYLQTNVWKMQRCFMYIYEIIFNYKDGISLQ